MIALKCIVVHYANLNSSQITGRRICYFAFFDFLFMFILTTLLLKTYEKTIIFNINFQNSFQDDVYYRILGCHTLGY